MAERELLRLAREVAAFGRQDPHDLGRALALVARACADATLTIARLAAWLEAQRDESRALALGWAREQLRLALEDLVTRETGAGRVRTDVSAATLSRLLLASCEAMVHEPPGELSERIEALLHVARPAAARDQPRPG